jgi:hypothetical protein
MPWSLVLFMHSSVMGGFQAHGLLSAIANMCRGMMGTYGGLAADGCPLVCLSRVSSAGIIATGGWQRT